MQFFERYKTKKKIKKSAETETKQFSLTYS